MATVYPTMERLVAGIAGSAATMDSVAERIAQIARANAVQHHGPTGAYESSIKVEVVGNGKDRLVVNTDPLAIPKEFGHVVVREGRQVGYARGIYAMTRAASALPRIT